MTITADLRAQIRQSANFACEFCGVTEIDVGGQLTIDHYQPKTKGGDDRFENLLYCCARCNQYKMDYWPVQPGDLFLWHPRQEPFSQHFLVLEDGTLSPLTPTGALTMRCLRLNRPPLVAHRFRQQQREQEIRLLHRHLEIVELLKQLQQQTTTLMVEQQALLEEQRELLRLLLNQEV